MARAKQEAHEMYMNGALSVQAERERSRFEKEYPSPEAPALTDGDASSPCGRQVKGSAGWEARLANLDQILSHSHQDGHGHSNGISGRAERIFSAELESETLALPHATQCRDGSCEEMVCWLSSELRHDLGLRDSAKVPDKNRSPRV